MGRPSAEWASRSRRVLGALLLMVSSVGCNAESSSAESSKVTIDVPDDLIAHYQRSAQSGEYVFYALADNAPAWESLVEAGIMICSDTRPPLIPQESRGMLDGGGFQPGTLLTLAGEVIEGELGIDRLLVTIPAVLSGCTDVALEKMAETPSMLLMVDSNVSFPGDDQLVEVVFE